MPQPSFSKDAVLRGVSALEWARTARISGLAVIALTAGSFVAFGVGSRFGPMSPGFVVGYSAGALAILALMLWLVSSLAGDRRNDREVVHGYVTLPVSDFTVPLVDSRTGEIIRPAGVRPSGRLLSISLKKERIAAADARIALEESAVEPNSLPSEPDVWSGRISLPPVEGNTSFSGARGSRGTGAAVPLTTVLLALLALIALIRLVSIAASVGSAGSGLLEVGILLSATVACVMVPTAIGLLLRLFRDRRIRSVSPTSTLVEAVRTVQEESALAKLETTSIDRVRHFQVWAIDEQGATLWCGFLRPMRIAHFPRDSIMSVHASVESAAIGTNLWDAVTLTVTSAAGRPVDVPFVAMAAPWSTRNSEFVRQTVARMSTIWGIGPR
jgi:hypothetical protein